MRLSSTMTVLLVLVMFILVSLVAFPQPIQPVLSEATIAQVPPRPTPQPREDPNPNPDPPLRRSGGGGKSSSSTPDLAVTADTSLMHAPIGDSIILTAYATNKRRATAQNVEVISTLPPFLELVHGTSSWGRVILEGNTVTVAMETLQSGDTVTIHIHARVVNYALPPYNSSTIVIKSSSDDDDSTNNSASFLVWTFAGE